MTINLQYIYLKGLSAWLIAARPGARRAILGDFDTDFTPFDVDFGDRKTIPERRSASAPLWLSLITVKSALCYQ
jgi:hypothetical protein